MTTLRMGENNSKWNNWQRINLQNIQAAHAAQYQKNKQPNQKVDRRPEQTSLQRRHADGSTSLITREMQIKTTMRYHLILIKMAIIRKSTNNKYWTGVEKRELSYTVVGMQTDKATMENSIEIPLKVRNKTTMWPSNPTTGHIPWGNHNWKRYMYCNVHCSTIYNS